MPLTPRLTFEQQLAEMVARVHWIGETVTEEWALAMQALVQNDAAAAERVIPLDNEVDQRRDHLEKDCLLLFTRQQPVASDLRAVAGTLKIADDLERIGDHAVNLSKRVHEAITQEVSLADPRVIAYGERVLDVFRLARKSLEENDRAAAEAITRQEDSLHAEAADLEMTLMQESSVPGAEVASLMGRLLAVHSFERAAAHSINIAERAIFEITGHRPHRGV